MPGCKSEVHVCVIAVLHCKSEVSATRPGDQCLAMCMYNATTLPATSPPCVCMFASKPTYTCHISHHQNPQLTSLSLALFPDLRYS